MLYLFWEFGDRWKIFQTGSGLRLTTEENNNFDLGSKNHQGLNFV